MSQPTDPIFVTIVGRHDTGRTTVASLFKSFLEENGFRDVRVEDTDPLPVEQKSSFWERFQRNRNRPIRIKVETIH